jgi:hypothetical protein
MGGEIWLSSKVGVGTSFFFTVRLGLSAKPMRNIQVRCKAQRLFAVGSLPLLLILVSLLPCIDDFRHFSTWPPSMQFHAVDPTSKYFRQCAEAEWSGATSELYQDAVGLLSSLQL